MIEIALSTLPNQQFAIQIDDRVYDISFREANGVMTASIARDGEQVITNSRVMAGTPLLPYRYQEAGNFIVVCDDESIPYYDQFGVTQFLVYLTSEEIAGLRQ